MLKIRKEQNDELAKAAVKRFEDWMVVHLQSTFPEQTKDMMEPDLRKMIQAGIDNAAKYDVTDEADVERYLECMVAYGPDFDTDSKTSWAGAILKNENLTGTEKMNQINDYELFMLAGNE